MGKFKFQHHKCYFMAFVCLITPLFQWKCYMLVIYFVKVTWFCIAQSSIIQKCLEVKASCIIFQIFPGVQLSLVLCHYTDKDKKVRVMRLYNDLWCEVLASLVLVLVQLEPCCLTSVSVYRVTAYVLWCTAASVCRLAYFSVADHRLT